MLLIFNFLVYLWRILSQFYGQFFCKHKIYIFLIYNFDFFYQFCYYCRSFDISMINESVYHKTLLKKYHVYWNKKFDNNWAQGSEKCRKIFYFPSWFMSSGSENLKAISRDKSLITNTYMIFFLCFTPINWILWFYSWLKLGISLQMKTTKLSAMELDGELTEVKSLSKSDIELEP